MTDWRLTLLVTLALGILFTPLAAEAQPTGKLYRIGYLGTTSPPISPILVDALRELGYVEGRNLVVEARYAEGSMERFPALASELVRLKPDVIVAAVSAGGILAVKAETSTIPIVMMGAGAVVETGIVASLARPGGNVTGPTADVEPGQYAKLPELLKEAVPKASTVAILFQPTNLGVLPFVEAVEAGATKLGMAARRVGVRVSGDFEHAFAELRVDRPGGLIVMPNPITFTHSKEIADFAIKSRLPTVFYSRRFVDAGGLMSYGAVADEIPRRAAAYVDKILRGARPADLPIEQPTRFELVINLGAAKALGLTIPPPLLQRADQLVN